MADVLAVSPRTVYRDMDSLSLAHVPVSTDHGPGGGYFLPPGYRLDPATFTRQEAVALALGAAMAGTSRLFDEDGMRQALVKMEAALPEEYRGDVRSASERILLDVSAWYRRPSGTEHLEAVRAAVWEGRQLDLFYRRSDALDAEWRRVEPYGLVCKAGTWYLAAYCRLREDFRTFRLSRIVELAVADEPVRPRPDFNLQTYWEESRRQFEESTKQLALTLRLSPDASCRLDNESVVLARESDGSAIIQVHLENLEYAVAYALSFGADAEVLDPPEVRAAVAREARALADVYESASAVPGPA
jgi:predicted DNA-binding transcriptional regulator YafY